MAQGNATVKSFDHGLVFRLVRALHDRKEKEETARIARVCAEADLIAALEFKREQGSETFKIACDEGSAKLTLEQPVTVKVLEDSVAELKKKLKPTLFNSVFRTKHEVIRAGLDALRESQRELYLECAKHISTKPGKVSVAVGFLNVSTGKQD